MNKSSTFGAFAEQYLQHQRALGRCYDREERIFASMCRCLQEHAMADLNQLGFDSWCQSLAHLSANSLRHRQLAMRKLCLFRRRTESDCFVPDPIRFARWTSYIAPVIFGPAEVARMLAAAAQITPAPNSPLRPAVLRLAVVLLYTAGLRHGELLRLTLADVDCAAGILRVRESKFHKSRLVPLSPDARRELRLYLKQRLAPPINTNPDSPLLCNCHGALRGYTGTGLSAGIQTLFRAAHVQSIDGRHPRVHDFRHSFAVQAMLRWYRQGADVQSNLPKLAMYMGHVSIVSTAYYLKWVPALAEAASQRFETCFGNLVSGGKS